VALEVRGSPPRYGEGDTSFRAAGGETGVRRLVDDFYDAMDALPEARAIRAMHPDDLAESRDKLATFLCGWLGGPRRYAERYGTLSIPGAHQHLDIGDAERDAWLLCMERAIARQGYAPEFAAYLLAQLRFPARRIVEVCALDREAAGG
jgi:hemoglobin